MEFPIVPVKRPLKFVWHMVWFEDRNLDPSNSRQNASDILLSKVIYLIFKDFFKTGVGCPWDTWEFSRTQSGKARQHWPSWTLLM